MKIVHLNFGLETGGTESMLVDILNEQSAFATIHLVVINNTYHAGLLNRIDNRVRVHLIDRPLGSRNPVYLLRLNSLLWRIKPDVIHCHNPNTVAHFRYPCRKYLTVHDVHVPATHFRQFDLLFAISKIVRGDIKNRSGRSANVVYNGIPVAMIRPKRRSYSGGLFRLVQISRLVHQKKGQHILLHAIHQLTSTYGLTNIQLDFIGDGDSLPVLTEQIKEYKLEPYVRFLGLKDRTYVYQHLAEYDLLVQPSLYEGFGLTVAEAMVAGVPVLVSDIEGPLEIINQGAFGSTFMSGQADDCARQLQSIISAYATHAFQEKIVLAQMHAKEAFDVRRTARQYLTAYNQPAYPTFEPLLSTQSV
ncbi:glycosyltransferase [Spirosoma sp. SC4-14]|uniref:glycosyltransferase n=1 Tax=Spirosoma sp. SC4-14 TaxID=3128900 RepID=UPI0030D50C67